MPLVVKLHTPRFLTSKFEVPNKKLKRFLNKYWFKTIHNTIENNYNRTIDKEYQLAKLANIVCSPSQFLIKEIKKDWNLKTVFHNPNLYEPSIEYLNIKQRFNGDKIVVTFIGSLCHRKGIDVFLEVIPKVLKRNKKIHFNFIGKDNWGPKYGSTTKKIFNSILSMYKNNIHFTGSVPLTQIPNYLAQTDFCIF